MFTDCKFHRASSFCVIIEPACSCERSFNQDGAYVLLRDEDSKLQPFEKHVTRTSSEREGTLLMEVENFDSVARSNISIVRQSHTPIAEKEKQRRTQEQREPEILLRSGRRSISKALGPTATRACCLCEIE